MARKRSATYDYKLRIREPLRRQIEAAAKKRGVSNNAEMTRRLERSFEQDDLFTLNAVAGNMDFLWTRWGMLLGRLDHQAALLRAADAILNEIENLPAEVRERPVFKPTVEYLRAAVRTAELEAIALIRRKQVLGQD
jgi:hypothetical protein